MVSSEVKTMRAKILEFRDEEEVSLCGTKATRRSGMSNLLADRLYQRVDYPSSLDIRSSSRTGQYRGTEELSRKLRCTVQ